jgi:hypothetical protein
MILLPSFDLKQDPNPDTVINYSTTTKTTLQSFVWSISSLICFRKGVTIPFDVGKEID